MFQVKATGVFASSPIMVIAIFSRIAPFAICLVISLGCFQSVAPILVGFGVLLSYNGATV